MTLLRCILRLLFGSLIQECPASLHHCEFECRETSCEDCRYLAWMRAKYPETMNQAQLAEMNAERWQD